MNQDIQNIVRHRFSCRSFANEPIREAHQYELRQFLTSLRAGPLGTQARFDLIAATTEDRRSLKGLGTYGFIKNPTGFIIGSVTQAENNLEDYGYLLEQAVLEATDLGLGTCWLGGTFTKSSFAKKASLQEGEIIPAVIATGYMEERKAQDGQIRRYLGANRRLPFEQLFFDNSFASPLTIFNAGIFAQPLEMVRWAPSASNRQPWRIIRIDEAWHFFLKRTKNYGKGTMIFNLMQLSDLQRVDMGIAMCHFELTLHEMGVDGRWKIENPKIIVPENTEYIVTWLAE
jgi:nitroreductase